MMYNYDIDIIGGALDGKLHMTVVDSAKIGKFATRFCFNPQWMNLQRIPVWILKSIVRDEKSSFALVQYIFDGYYDKYETFGLKDPVLTVYDNKEYRKLYLDSDATVKFI